MSVQFRNSLANPQHTPVDVLQRIAMNCGAAGMLTRFQKGFVAIEPEGDVLFFKDKPEVYCYNWVRPNGAPGVKIGHVEENPCRDWRDAMVMVSAEMTADGTVNSKHMKAAIA